MKLFVAHEIQYFELRIFSFNLYVYYLFHGFIASTHAFNLPTHAFNVATHAFSLVTCGFELETRNSCFTFPHLFIQTQVFCCSKSSNNTKQIYLY